MKQKSLVTNKKFIVLIVIAILCGSSLLHMAVDLTKVYSGIVYRRNLYDSNLPHVSNKFVGREKELEDILSSLDFNNVTRLVTIVGSPGFGKSALALQAGHQLLRNGISVFYVDMREAPNVLALAEKVLDSAQIYAQKVTVDRMLKWAKTLGYESVLILDNCDGVLDNYQDEFQDVVEKSLASSQKLKIVTTSSIKKIYLEYSHHINLPPLPTDDACHLLESFVSTLNQSEKEKIVQLTGSVPLALRVVVSILRGPDHPDPQVIIKKLSDELIKTLSPEELSTNKQVNTSIYLSYKHLTSMSQKAGRYLAKFPASFDGALACNIFHSVAYQVENCSDILKTLQQRSLLEHNRRTQRYQFHPLIREFFLSMQKSLGINKKENTRFTLAFIHLYTNLLNEIAKHSSAKSTSVYSLNLFDTESLNILHMLLMVSNPSKELKEHTFSCLSAMKVVCNFDLFELLQGHFAVDVLYDSFKRIGKLLQELASLSFVQFYIHTDLPLYFGTDFDGWLQFRVYLFSTYVLHTDHLFRLTYRKFGQEKMYDLILKQKEWVERIYDGISSKATTVFYLQFYRTCVLLIVSDFVSSLYKECHEKILKATDDLKDCSSDTNCEYNSIGLAYHAIGKAKEAKMFLQLAIDHQPQMGLMRRVHILIILSDLYLIDGNSEKSDQLATEAIGIFPILIELSATDLQHFQAEIQETVSFYRTHGKYREAMMLETKQFDNCLSFQKSMNWKKFITAWKIAQTLYEEGNYSKALEVLSVALNGYKHFYERDHFIHIHIQMQILAGKIELDVGNFSSGVHYFLAVISYIQENDVIHLYASELREACLRLAIKAQLHSCLGGVLSDAAMFILHLVFRAEVPESLPPGPVENSDEMLFQDLVLSTALSVPESHVTAALNLNHFGLYYYYNTFVLLLEKFFYGVLSFIFSFAFVVFLVNCLFILLKLSICSVLCGLTCFICCRICQWITLFILFLCFTVAVINNIND